MRLHRALARAVPTAALAVVVAVSLARADHGYWPAAGVDPAKVAGHATRTAATADPAYWGAECTSYGAGDGGLGQLDVYGAVLDRDYGIVVVLAVSEGIPVEGSTGITYFLGPEEGEFVWADIDGNDHFANAHEADIQTVIACATGTQAATDTAAGDAEESGAGPIGPLLLALAVAVGVLVALRVRRPPQG
jgi:hypothetical protein